MEDYYDAHAIKGITDVVICSDFLSDNNGYILMLALSVDLFHKKKRDLFPSFLFTFLRIDQKQ